MIEVAIKISAVFTKLIIFKIFNTVIQLRMVASIKGVSAATGCKLLADFIIEIVIKNYLAKFLQKA